MKNIIVAYDQNRAIGYNNELLWKRGEMREDMKRFRELTTNSAIIMGRKTLESIGMVLPMRKNIILTRSENIGINGVEIAHSIDEANDLAKSYDNIFYIGGGDVYRQALDEVNRIYATEINASVTPADTFFPRLDQTWQVTNSEDHDADDRNIYSYTFKTYERK